MRATSFFIYSVSALLLLIGSALLVGGAILMWLGGSVYYVLAGAGLLASSYYISRRKTIGLWVYCALFAVTFVWSLAEAGSNFWAWVPRMVGPFILLLSVGALAPLLKPRRLTWQGYGIAAIGATILLAVASTILYQSRLIRTGGEGLPPAKLAQLPQSEWPSYGGDNALRFSPIDQIDTQNVGRLEKVWIAHTGDLPESTEDNSYGAETTPLKVGKRLYLCSATNTILALDAASGTEIWRYDPGVSKDWIPYTAACRGVAYHKAAASQDGVCAERIIEGTLDGRIVAVDAETGEPCRDFGDGGEVDIKLGMGPVVPGMVAITSPPAIVDGVIVSNHQVLDGQKLDAPSGAIKGFDVVSGALLWSWDMTRPDIDRLPPEGETFTRGTPNSWTIASGDDDLGLVYVPMGNSAVDYWSSTRSESENEYATSLVAIDVHTGKPAWRFQTVHKDVWDYDLGSQPSLIDYPSQDGPVPAILLSSKQGDIYILDRATGEPLTGVEERLVPKSGVEPEQRAITQPYSLFHTLAKSPLKERDMWGMTLIDQMICRIQYRKAAYEGMYTPPTSQSRWIEYPGYNGGSDWGSVAIDPRRGVLVANYNDMPNYNRLVPRAEADRLGWAPRGEARGGSLSDGGAEGAGDPQTGAPYAIDVNAGWRLPLTGLLCKAPPYGGIRAVSLETGAVIWDRDLGTARRNGPFGIPSGIPLTIGTPNNGGPLVTAGNLVFIAAATDNLIRAIDLRTGKTLWQDTLPAGGQATPMTYSVDGRQYLVLMTGGHHFMETPVGDEVIAWALPAGTDLPRE